MSNRTTQLSSDKADLKQRLMAFFIDWFIYGLIVNLFFSLLRLAVPSFEVNIVTSFLLPYVFWFFLLIVRDSIKFLSFGKSVLRIKIVEIDQLGMPRFWKLFLRNLPIIVFPVDICVYLITDRTIGDHLTKTDIIDTRASEKSLAS